MEKPDIVGITETWISTTTTDFEGEYDLLGYKMFKRDRIGKKGGWVLLYIKESLNPVDCEIVTENEILGVVLKNLKKELYLYLVYRPPHQTIEKDESFYRHLSTAIKDKFCILMGDFNCPKVNWKNRTADVEGKRLLELVSEELLTQWVDTATRGNNILDLVFTTEDNLIANLTVGEKLEKGDHNIVNFEINVIFSEKEKILIKPDFRKADFEKLRNKMKEIGRSTEVDVESKWNFLKSKYMQIRSECIPQKNVGSKRHAQPRWFNNDIANKIKERQRAYKSSKQNPTEENIKIHRKHCRNVTRTIKRAKLDNEQRVANAAKANPKVFYAHVNSRKPIKSSIGPLKDSQGNVISCDVGMAELLNEYFTSVYTEEDLQGMPTVPTRYQGNEPLEKINLTVERVKDKLRKLNPNKSPGPDGFYPREIKEVESELAPHLYDVYQASLE